MSRTKSEFKLLVVDDDPANVRFLDRLLALDGYTQVFTATSGIAAIEHTVVNCPDLVLLDLQMPGIDGYEVLETIRATIGPEGFLPILVFTADATMQARKRALELGASDFLTKPGEAQEILLRVKNFLIVRDLHHQLTEKNQNLEELVRARTQELEASQMEIIERLALAGERRDDDTGEHTRRVSELSASIALRMGLPERTVDLLLLTARLHDLGKIGVPDSVLLKPGKLTAAEYSEMQRHCVAGANILSNGQTPLLQMAERIARSHHEKFDGTGYPEGLSGEDIPIEARIVAVADVFDALSHARPYKPAWEISAAIAEIKNQRGRHFDPDIVDAFLSVMDSVDGAD